MDIDREEWNRRWSSMPHKHISDVAALDFHRDAGLGAVRSATISLVPPEYVGGSFVGGSFVGGSFFATDVCPLCSKSTEPVQRIAASLHPKFERITGVSFGVWVHQSCFDRLEVSDQPTPFPW